MRQPWELVADALRRAIRDQTYKPGDQLPSESQLAAQHHASRPTIRRALQDLRLKGLIETRQGKGAFVRMPSPLAITLTAENYNRHQREGRPGFSAQMEDQGHTSHQDILEVATVPAPSEIAQRLGLDEGQDVVMRRLRFVVDDTAGAACSGLLRAGASRREQAGTTRGDPGRRACRAAAPRGAGDPIRRGLHGSEVAESRGGASAPASKRCTGDSKYPNGLRWRSTRRGNGHHFPWRGGVAPLRDQAMKRLKELVRREVASDHGSLDAQPHRAV